MHGNRLLSRFLKGTLAVILAASTSGTAFANSVNRPFRYNNVSAGQQITLIDFAVTTTAGHSGAFSTFNSPSSSGVKYVDVGHYGGGVGRCFAYQFTSVDSAPPDIIAWANTGSVSSPIWTRISDDIDGNFPRFRVWVGPNWLDTKRDALRLAAYFTSGNGGQFRVAQTDLGFTQAQCESGTGAMLRLDTGVTVVRSN